MVVTTENEDGETGIAVLVVRSDHQLNEIKAEKLPNVQSPLTFATEQQIQDVLGCEPGSIDQWVLIVRSLWTAVLRSYQTSSVVQMRQSITNRC